MDHEDNVHAETIDFLDTFFIDTWEGEADPEEYKGWKIFSKGNTFTSITYLYRYYQEGKDGSTCEGTCSLTANMALLGLQGGTVVCIPFGEMVPVKKEENTDIKMSMNVFYNDILHNGTDYNLNNKVIGKQQLAYTGWVYTIKTDNKYYWHDGILISTAEDFMAG